MAKKAIMVHLDKCIYRLSLLFGCMQTGNEVNDFKSNTSAALKDAGKIMSAVWRMQEISRCRVTC